MDYPKSVAIIPDGNRRFAKKHSLSFSNFYQAGFKKVESALGWGEESGVEKMTFWALSLDNLQKRSSFELALLFKLMEQNISSAFSNPAFEEKGIKARFFGRLDLLPQSLREKISVLEEKTRGNKSFELNVAIAYSGQEELVNASRKLALDLNEGKIREGEVNAQTFSKYLYFNQAPDLIIRTGGVQRLSSFMPFHTGYSELFFSKKLWPEFTKRDFNSALAHYAGTQRRFGK
ncbi:di-trans,poly-cis-decaprenylcistransferase [Candidatus Micrarchaeota archaeon]|nr:di-trans,poly-cis-decaprenylcistransferase [Candidatus Micrarchaeota archaeon]